MICARPGETRPGREEPAAPLRGLGAWQFLLILVVLLAIVLFPLVRGLVSGVGAPSATPAPSPAPAAVDVETVPGTGAATGFDACAVLSPDVVAAAGLKYASAVVKTAGTNSCGGPVEPVTASSAPTVLLTVGEQKVTGTATSHGIRYERQDGVLDAAVVFPAAKLQLTHFAVIPGGEGVLGKLIDGVAARLEEGPKPAPGYRYPGAVRPDREAV